MKKQAVWFIVISLCSGCASTARNPQGNLVQRYTAARQLEQADEMLEKGDRAGAAKALHAVVSAPAAPGVTDQALFRLALLTLKPGLERSVSAQAQQLLKRLAREYPRSPWTAQAEQLNDLIEVADDLRHQNKSLKGSNQSLTKEINDLNNNLERLKQLDQELEKSAR
uniref:Lipoprotein n=1 Tax=Geobacter sp. (strain M21) TaxID=443144 RepID=C6E8Y1_GEOSM